MTAVIKTERLTKAYGEHRGIIELDLEVAEGEIFGFLGPNGAGKTTTMRVLLDLIRPTSGRAEVFGIETTADPARDPSTGRLPARRVRPVRPPDRRPDHRVLRQPARRHRPRLRRAARSSMLDLDPSRRFREYSKGNKQKVGLVVALQHRPDLLILDEPTSGLDPLVQQTFFGLVREARDEGRTVFLSSHIIDEVDRTCDRVAIIREGRLVQVDRIEAIRALAFHHVELTFEQPVAPAVFEGLPGVSDVVVDGHIVTMRVSGPIGARHRGRRPARHRRRRQPRTEPRGRLPRPVRGAPDRRSRRVAVTTDARALARPTPDRPDRGPRLDLRQDASATAAGRRSSSVVSRRSS